MNALSARLLALNTDYTEAQSDRLRKEALFDATKSGTIAGAQVTNQSAMMDAAMTRLNQARSDFARISAVFGENHPEIQKQRGELNELQQQFDHIRNDTIERAAVDYRQTLEREQMSGDLLAKTKVEVDGLTARAFEYQRLKEESENYRKLYDDLERITREQVINRGLQEAILQVVDPAKPSAKPASPNMLVNVLAALVFSFIIGLGGVVFLDSLDGRIRTPQDAEKLPNVELIAAMPRLAGALRKRRGRAVVGKLPKASRTDLLLLYEESVRILRNSILFARLDRPFRSLVVTGPRASENGPIVIANLAWSFALLGHKVLLIDADLRDPSLHHIFEKTPSSGLADVVLGKIEWKDTLMKVAREHLFLMPAGVAADNMPDHVPGRMRRILEAAFAEFDLVLVMAPPVLSASESAPLAGVADAVLVMADSNYTVSADITAAYAQLRRARANIIGMVLNEVPGLEKANTYRHNKKEARSKAA